jgi:biotin transporter BioY
MSRESVISLSGIDQQGWPDGHNNKESLDELLDGAPGRPLFQRASYPPRLSLNGLLISLLSTILIVFLGYIPVTLPSPLEVSRLVQTGGIPLDPALIRYSFQIPAALMIGAFLGPFMGTMAVLLFLVIGLCCYPVFANGGGIQYLSEPGFGYLLGTLFAAFLLGRDFHKVFQKNNRPSRSLNLVAMTVATVVLVQLVGVLYLGGLAVAGKIPVSELLGWVLRLSVETAPYDLLATFVFLCLVRQLRLGLWLVLY